MIKLVSPTLYPGDHRIANVFGVQHQARLESLGEYAESVHVCANDEAP